MARVITVLSIKRADFFHIWLKFWYEHTYTNMICKYMVFKFLYLLTFFDYSFVFCECIFLGATICVYMCFGGCMRCVNDVSARVWKCVLVYICLFGRSWVRCMCTCVFVRELVFTCVIAHECAYFMFVLKV